MTARNSDDLETLRRQCFPEPGTASSPSLPAPMSPPPSTPSRVTSVGQLKRSAAVIDLDDSDVEVTVAAPSPKVARLSAHPEPFLPEPDMHDDTSDDIGIDMDFSESDTDDGPFPHVVPPSRS